MAPPIFALIKLLFDPDVSKKLILQMALKQIKAIGYGKVLAALLGAAMVGVSSFIKIPQIQKIVNPNLLSQRQSVAKGLSLESISLESFAQLVHVVFNNQNKVPFINYGESFFLGIQNAILILLVSFYRDPNAAAIENEKQPQRLIDSLGVVAKPAAVMAATAVVLTKIVPPGVIDFLEVLNIPIGIAAKVPQIRNNHQLKSTSHLSNITIRANVIGSLIRVFTTVTDLNSKRKRGKNSNADLVLLAGYATSFILNSTLVYQSVIYSDNNTNNKKKEE